MIHLEANYKLKSMCLKESAIKDLIDSIKYIRSLPSQQNRRFNEFRNTTSVEIRSVITYLYWENAFYPIALTPKILRVVANNSNYDGCLDIIKLRDFMKKIYNSKNRASLAKQHKEELLSVIPKWLSNFSDDDLRVFIDWLKGKAKSQITRENLKYLHMISRDFMNKNKHDFRKDIIFK